MKETKGINTFQLSSNSTGKEGKGKIKQFWKKNIQKPFQLFDGMITIEYFKI